LRVKARMSSVVSRVSARPFMRGIAVDFELDLGVG
jgi:hypothetical protein